ncbi:MAG TPA: biopolymer transporter ExbD, partial [Pseudomonadales bacterium]|nr:biopolymer transporter ExbD [Pseudomonadales bacterium]
MPKAARRKPMSEINVVPYIDVMLVLLVIFMVAAPLMTQGINVDLPNANSKPIKVDQNEQTLVVSVKADNTYYMNVGKEDEPVALKDIGERATKILQANPDIKV